MGISNLENKKSVKIAREIWANPELSLKEYKAEAIYAKALAEAGFEVEEGVGGIPTAVSGSYGSGSPVIGVLAEYDALSGVGHGCGHNLLGAGSFEAACKIKDWLESSGKPGTVIFYGCPGEEGGASKAYFARDGIWKELDAAITWHPDTRNKVVTGTCQSCIQVLYKFHGKPAHASGTPEMGRSALDAVELMNTGVQYLREHMPGDARIHYAITDAGGMSPNVVQPEAAVLYMTRSILGKDCQALQDRVDKIAEGAALMTETTYDRIFVDACANLVPNHTLEKMMQEALESTDKPVYSEAEYAQALEIAKTLDPDAEKGIDEKVYGLGEIVDPPFGSSDVGDVSWLTPTVQVHTACFAVGSPGHSEQNTAAAGSCFGEKGMLYAADVLTNAAKKLFSDPELLAAAKKEHDESVASKGGFVSLIPDDAVPYVIE